MLLSQLVLPPGEELLPADLKHLLPPACLDLVTQVTLQEGSATPQLRQAADGEWSWTALPWLVSAQNGIRIVFDLGSG